MRRDMTNHTQHCSPAAAQRRHLAKVTGAGVAPRVLPRLVSGEYQPADRKEEEKQSERRAEVLGEDLAAVTLTGFSI